MVESWSSVVVPVVIVSVLVLVYDYYIDAACTAHLDAVRTGQLGTMFVLASALALSAVWNNPFVERVASMLDLSQLTSTEHQISAGVVFSAVMFAFGELHSFKVKKMPSTSVALQLEAENCRWFLC